MLKTTPHSSPGLEPLRVKSQNKSPITQELLNNFLYGREKVERIELHKSRKRKGSFEEQDKRKIQAARREECCNSSQNECAVHSSSLPKLTYAVRSFPPEVQLCTSSIPGYKYGARAESPIPRGTWIGPYEGTHVYRTNVTEDKDNAYLWEIYENGQFSHFLDGSDENISSWMRFIRCARNKNEQNMTAFQYGTSIYYRALRDISVGEELLVWYDYTYTQFWGVPLALKSEMEVRGKGTIPEVPVVAQHSNLPGFQRPQPTQPKLSLSSQGTPSSPQTQRSPDQAVVYPPPSVSLTIPPTVPEPFSPTMASHTLKRSPQVPSQHLVARSYHVTQTQHYPQTSSISASHQLPPRPPQVSPQSQVPPSPYVPPQPRVPLLPHAPTQPRVPLPPQVLPPSQPPPLPLVQAQSHVPTSPHVQPQSHVLRPPHLTQFPTTSVPQGTAMSQVTPYSITPSSCRVTSASHGASLSTVPTSPLSHHQYPSRVPPSPKLVSIHSSLGVSTKTTNYRTVTAQNSHEGMKDSASLTYTWSQADIKENMPVSTPINKTEIQFRSPYTSQSLKSSPLKSLSPSINKTATTECDEQDQNHVSSTVNCKEEYQESWKCGQCGEVFSQRVLLRMHECSRAPEKPYQCGHCSLTFANPSELRAHVVTHSNERPFKCGYCGRSFAGATTLSNHMRTHTGDRPHVCEKCKKTFVTAMQLSRHAKQPGECVLREKDALWVNKSLPITVE